jgi:hypothetical protein
MNTSGCECYSCIHYVALNTSVIVYLPAMARCTSTPHRPLFFKEEYLIAMAKNPNEVALSSFEGHEDTRRFHALPDVARR